MEQKAPCASILVTKTTPGRGSPQEDAIIPSRHQRAIKGLPTQRAPEHAFRSSNWEKAAHWLPYQKIGFCKEK